MILYLTDAFYCEVHTIQISLGGTRRRESDYETIQTGKQHEGRPDRTEAPASASRRESTIIACHPGLHCSPFGCLRRRPHANAGARCHRRADCNPYAYCRADGDPRAYSRANGDPPAYSRAYGNPRAYSRADCNPRAYSRADCDPETRTDK